MKRDYPEKKFRVFFVIKSFSIDSYLKSEPFSSKEELFTFMIDNEILATG